MSEGREATFPADGPIEPGSDVEVALRGEWMSRLMFGWMIGQRDPGTYAEWLALQGYRLA